MRYDRDPVLMAARIVAAPCWAPIRELHNIPMLVVNGKVSLPQLRELNGFLAYRARRRDPEMTQGFFEKYGTKRSLHELCLLQAAFGVFFERSPAHRELEKAVANKRRGGSRDLKPYPQRHRRFSLYPQELPGAWQQALADMEIGLPGVACAAPADPLITTTRTKLCELALVIRNSDLEAELSIETLSAYEHSLYTRERSLSPKTILSALRQLRDFGKYIGIDEDLERHLAARIRLWEDKSERTSSFKEGKVMALPTYAEIAGTAFDLLGEAERLSNPRHAQLKRNVAVALVLFCPFPMRVADTKIRFGHELLWDGSFYRFNIRTSKTGVPYAPTIIPAYGMFIDLLVLQGSSPEHLESLRQKCFHERRPLFVSHEDHKLHAGFVSRAWRMEFGTGCHAARTKLHDELAPLGQEGVELAMRACGQRSEKTAEFYRTRAYDLAMVKRVHDNMLAGITEDEWQTYFD